MAAELFWLERFCQVSMVRLEKLAICMYVMMKLNSVAAGGEAVWNSMPLANGLVRLARQYIAQDIGHSTVFCLEQDFTAKDVFDAAKAGDPLALQLVEKVGDYLGRSLAQIACVADPEAFVIGGGMAKAGEILLQSVQKYFRRYAFHACEKIEFKLAELGNTAGIYGSAKMILDI